MTGMVRALDRLWTYTVWAAFLFIAPIWVILWYERHPLLGLVQGLCIVWFLGRHAVRELRGRAGKNPTRDAFNPPDTARRERVR